MKATKHTERVIGKAKVSSLIPALKQIATEWKLNFVFIGEKSFMCSAGDFKTARRILNNSVKNN